MKPNRSSQLLGNVDQALIDSLVSGARRRLWSMDEAEACDVVGDVWIKFLEKGPPEDMGSLKAYLSGMIKNISIDRYRQRRSQPIVEQSPLEPESTDCAVEVDYVNSYALTQILDQLPKIEHEVLKLSFLDDMSLTDVADKMNLSYSKAQRIRTRALARCTALAGLAKGDRK